jgi:hypothetical protein
MKFITDDKEFDYIFEAIEYVKSTIGRNRMFELFNEALDVQNPINLDYITIPDTAEDIEFNFTVSRIIASLNNKLYVKMFDTWLEKQEEYVEGALYDYEDGEDTATVEFLGYKIEFVDE